MTVVPGFIESHNHTLLFGLGLSAIDLTKVRSIAEILVLVRERASRKGKGTWIIGVGYNCSRPMDTGSSGRYSTMARPAPPEEQAWSNSNKGNS